MIKEKYFQKIVQLQKKPENVRNVAIIAHVDHGKTTLADCLIASNQIISEKQVGELRFLDSRVDEQERLITMKSSSISLLFTDKDQQDYLINLMDSPGHIEFSSEVAYSLRLADGALLLVDVLEGVSSQTYTVLRQAINENITLILVLNKIDRIIQEVQLSPEEGYAHIQKIIEEINGFISAQLQEKYWSWASDIKNPEDKEKFFEELEQKFQFYPQKGNVIFASATHGWAFTLETFAQIFSKKLKFKKEKLQSLLWGNYYLNMKEKKITKEQQNSKQQPMVIDFIFNNI